METLNKAISEMVLDTIKRLNRKLIRAKPISKGETVLVGHLIIVKEANQ